MSVARISRAERREQTRSGLIDAAERLFTSQGFHATSVDQIAAEAGYTKGAVYSNFDAKEDLFFAVYERRADHAVEEMEQAFAGVDAADGLQRVAAAAARRRGTAADGWLAVFFEFWAHVVRHPELRERFAQVHARAIEPLVEASERLARERGFKPPTGSRSFAIAMTAMQTGLSLERLTQPDVVDPELGTRVQRMLIENMERAAGARKERRR